MPTIVINASPVPSAVTTGLRYLATAAGGWLAAHGYIAANQIDTLVGAALVFAPLAWGVARAVLNRWKLVQVATLEPGQVILKR